MVRFSCFNAHVHSHKPKKTIQPSVEAFHKTLQDCSHSRFSDVFPNKTSPLLLNSQGRAQVTSDIKHVSSSVRGWKSEDLKNKFIIEGELLGPRRGHLKKSQSLESGLCREGMVSAGNGIEDETDLGLSCDGSREVRDGSKDQEVTSPDQYQKAPTLDTFQVSCDIANNESTFSIEVPPQTEKEGHENSGTPLSGECSDHALNTPHGFVKSRSSPNLSACSPISASCAHLCSRSRSSEDLHVLDMRWKDISIHDVEKHSEQGQVGDDNINKAEKCTFENYVDDNYDSCNYSGLAKDWIMPVVDKIDSVKNLQGESSLHHWDELPNRDYKIKRIEEWVSDLQHCSPLEETNESFQSNDHMKRDPSTLNGFAAEKVEDKVTPGMEAAKRYISSLSAAAAAAQLANHGLVAIPFLSAFVSLRVLNLSGNAIVRITAGALPQGLHMLNLSKNNISTIEGLRELTRLRVLDLSYNRIYRIGHGLASCSSLKELYLAGNRISEVEGLHRLLKLTVLDLRFNKISTAKCLGQLAANYGSLQAISLEGNPAQKNVGDDQLKKHLQGLLPHLAYFNRQPIKASTLKDSAERSVRLGISSHQFDRCLRPDHKATRKGSVLTAQRPVSSSSHGRGSQAVGVSPKHSRGRHGRLPPSGGTKATTHSRHHYFDFGSKLLNFKPDLSMRRSRSEGTLGAF
ncbi:LRR domain containing protein [Parasponia andersonii]|uniref:LRR domain containing protein n=1 Tax=Parasponia andersonii TaxID=3476 RepID=A0A2P5E4Q9_PARAD|nr:LRR domain containing protein [Parasponia andersonii]